MRAQEFLTETFNQPYPMTWEQGDESYDALVKLPDGTNLSIMFSMDYGAYGDEEWAVEFWRNNSQDVTGEGDAQRIFATVLSAIQQFINKEHPERIRFSASKEDNDGNNNQSRTGLYTRLVQRYANSWGYSVEVSDHAGSTVYELFNDLNEVTTVPTVAKGKRAHLDVMPNDGKPIPPGDEADYMGKKIGRLGSKEVWTYNLGTLKHFVVFDPESRRSQLAVSGSRYPDNENSFIVHGLYSGPSNDTRAANLYAWLVTKLGLTLVSDNKQSPGGYRVWQDLERRFGRHMNIYAFNTRTDEPLNVSTLDEPETHVDRERVHKGGPDIKDIPSNIRLVASPK